MVERRERGVGRLVHDRHGRSQRAAEDRASSAPTEAFYRTVIERVPAVVYVDASDEASSSIYVSPQSEGLLGYAREEWLQDPELWVKTLHPEDKERVLDAHHRARESGGAFGEEYRLIARDGSVVWVRDEAAAVGGEGGGPERRMGVLLDITERKRHEEELKKSEERFRLVAQATGEAIWDNDLISGKQVWDGATEALFGYPPHGGRTGAWWEERIHPDDRERVLWGLEDVYRGGGGEAWEEEYRFRRADGSYAEVEDRGHVVRDAEGRPVRMVGSRVWVNLYVSLARGSSGEPDYFICVAEDITARKLGELLPDPLTPREMEVLRRIAAGWKNPQIAEDLAYGLGTVKLDVRNILAKLSARDRRRAAARAIEIGLVHPPC